MMGSKPWEGCCPIEQAPQDRHSHPSPQALVNMLGFPSPRFPLKILISSLPKLVVEGQMSGGHSVSDVAVVFSFYR